jgi:hypothetical protein
MRQLLWQRQQRPIRLADRSPALDDDPDASVCVTADQEQREINITGDLEGKRQVTGMSGEVRK